VAAKWRRQQSVSALMKWRRLAKAAWRRHPKLANENQPGVTIWRSSVAAKERREEYQRKHKSKRRQSSFGKSKCCENTN
jgi:hypothetical protein